MSKESGYDELIHSGNFAIADAAVKFKSVLETHNKAMVSISGGYDSDVMLDMCERVRSVTGSDVHYVWFDTGIEYGATREHIGYLENHYEIRIDRHKPKKTIPVSCKQYGLPFFSKYVSECMERLQRHGFQWEDEPFETLMERYPNTKMALRWWCNKFTKTGEPGYYDIGSRTYLKEFIVKNPPDFKISNKCCEHTKKNVAMSLIRRGGFDLDIVGLRKVENGVRAKRKGVKCFHKGSKVDSYYPLFWFTQDDRDAYKSMFGIRNSDAYELWGLKRTGCVGCPFNHKYEYELDIAQRFEPGIASLAHKIFADSYEYTKAFAEYKLSRRAESKQDTATIS